MGEKKQPKNPDVLIVEDDIPLGFLLKRALEKKEYCPTVVGTASAALHEILNTSYELVLLDIRLPDADGLELVETFLQHDVEVIVMSAHTEIEHAIRAIQKGAYTFLPKPFELPHLQIEVQRAIEARKMRQDLTLLQDRIQKKYVIPQELHHRGYIFIPVGTSMEDAERIIIKKTLEEMDGNKTQTCKVLQISPSTLYAKLKQSDENPV